MTLWDSQSGYVNHVYSGLDIIFENSSSGCTKHFYANGLHIAENRSGVIEYYHQDHLGSTRLKTNSTGGVVFSSNYIPFGPAYDSEGTEEFKYTGKYEDSTGLYYFGARYYDPDTGRFITADTVLGDLEDPQTLNKYIYARNSPLKYTDPTGRWVNVAVGAIVGGVAGFISYALTHPGESFNWWEAGIETLSGAVMGGMVSVAGPAATLGMKAFMATSAATVSWSVENTLKAAVGLVEPQSAAGIATELITKIGTSLVVAEVVGEVVPRAANLLGKVISRGVPAYYCYPHPPRAPLEEMLSRTVIGTGVKTIVRHISSSQMSRVDRWTDPRVHLSPPYFQRDYSTVRDNEIYAR